MKVKSVASCSRFIFCRCLGDSLLAFERFSKRKRNSQPRIDRCQVLSGREIKIPLDNVIVVAVL